MCACVCACGAHVPSTWGRTWKRPGDLHAQLTTASHSESEPEPLEPSADTGSSLTLTTRQSDSEGSQLRVAAAHLRHLPPPPAGPVMHGRGQY